jgi:hypothetical protein
MIGLGFSNAPDDLNPLTLTLEPSQPFASGLMAKSPHGAAFAGIQTDPTNTWTVGLNISKAEMETLSENVEDLFLLVSYTAQF